jgi:hypothetical protein
MKLAISILIALAATAGAQTYTAPATKKNVKKPTPPPPLSQREGNGAVQRGARGGNLLQMVNPKAPAKYGTSADSVILDADTGKWRGIKLFEFNF